MDDIRGEAMEGLAVEVLLKGFSSDDDFSMKITLNKT